jgi:hypothetical protein
VIGFRLNPQTNDIEAVGGKIKLLSTLQEAVRQRLSVKLKTFQGEYFLDTSYGVPYRGLNGIIGKGRSQQEVDAVFIDIINQDPDIQRIVYFNSVYNPTKRDYALDFEVKVNDVVLRDNVQSFAFEEITYPEPDEYHLTSNCPYQAPEDYVDPFYIENGYIMTFTPVE